MSRYPIAERIRLADQIRAIRRQVAENVTTEFLLRHPDWTSRYGARARTAGIEDAIFHLDFLAAAIETGEPLKFAEYLRWTSGVLASRGIAANFLRENVGQILRELQSRIPNPVVDLAAFVERALNSAPPSNAETGPDPSGAQPLYLQAILSGQRRAAAGIAVEAMTHGQSITDVFADILQESMYQVGRLWESNRITVAQEHMATAITQHVIAQLYPLIQPTQPCRGKMVITGVEGEHHQVGPNMVADVLESAGWDVRFLGCNTPLQGVLQAVEEHRADVLGISATMLFNLPAVRRLITEGRALAGLKLRFILGGSAFRGTPELYKELGADGVALDVRSALRLAETH